MPHITRTPEAHRKFLASRAAIQLRGALRRHTEAVETLALRAAVERRANPRAAETAAWQQRILADLNRPRNLTRKTN